MVYFYVGMFPASVSHDSSTTCEALLYVVERGSCILGRDLITALRLTLQDNVVMNIALSLESEFPQLFRDGIGLAKGYVHRVKTKSVPPVQHKLRRLPFAIRDKVSALVVVHKKNGDIRLC